MAAFAVGLALSSSAALAQDKPPPETDISATTGPAVFDVATTRQVADITPAADFESSFRYARGVVAVRPGDFDGDGNEDVAVVARYSRDATGLDRTRTFFLFGQNHGGLRTGPSYEGSMVHQVGDFNADGMTDLFWYRLDQPYGRWGGQPVVSLSQVDASGEWSLAEPQPLPEISRDFMSVGLYGGSNFTPGVFYIADYNGDGRPDALYLRGIDTGNENNGGTDGWLRPRTSGGGAHPFAGGDGWKDTRKYTATLLLNVLAEDEADGGEEARSDDEQREEDAVDAEGGAAAETANVLRWKQVQLFLVDQTRQELQATDYSNYYHNLAHTVFSGYSKLWANPNGAGYFFFDQDFTGDGACDLFVRRNDGDRDDTGGKPFSLMSYVGETLRGEEGLLFQSYSFGSVGPFAGSANTTGENEGARWIPGDFNGDGVTDILRLEYGTWATTTDDFSIVRDDAVAVLYGTGDGKSFTTRGFGINEMTRFGLDQFDGASAYDANGTAGQQPFRVEGQNLGYGMEGRLYPDDPNQAGDQSFFPDSTGVTVADFTGDGRDDIALVRISQTTKDVRVLEGRPGNLFANHSATSLRSDLAWNVAVPLAADVNGDGRKDLVFIHATFDDTDWNGNLKLGYDLHLSGKWYDDRLEGTTASRPSLVRAFDKTLLVRRALTPEAGGATPLYYAVQDSQEEWIELDPKATPKQWLKVPFPAADEALAAGNGNFVVRYDGRLVNIFWRVSRGSPALYVNRFVMEPSGKLTAFSRFDIGQGGVNGGPGALREVVEGRTEITRYWDDTGGVQPPAEFDVALGEGTSESQWIFATNMPASRYAPSRVALVLFRVGADGLPLLTGSQSVPISGPDGTTSVAVYQNRSLITLRSNHLAQLSSEPFQAFPALAVANRLDYERNEDGSVRTVHDDGTLGPRLRKKGAILAIGTLKGATLATSKIIAYLLPLTDRGMVVNPAGGPYADGLTPFIAETSDRDWAGQPPCLFESVDGLLHAIAFTATEEREWGIRLLLGAVDANQPTLPLYGFPPTAAIVRRTDADAARFRAVGEWKTGDLMKIAQPSAMAPKYALAAVEYPRVIGQGNNLRGIMRRLLLVTDTTDTIRPVPAGRVANLRLRSLGRTIADAQLVGYIESAPPIPSELARKGGASSTTFSTATGRAYATNGSIGGKGGLAFENLTGGLYLEAEVLIGSTDETEDTTEISTSMDYTLSMLLDPVTGKPRQLGLAYLRGKEARIFELLNPSFDIPVSTILYPTGRDATKIVPFGVRRDHLNLDQWTSVNTVREAEAFEWENEIDRTRASATWLANTTEREDELTESLVNRYQWTAYGGLFSTRTEVTKGHTESTTFGVEISAGIGAGWGLDEGVGITVKAAEGKVFAKGEFEYTSGSSTATSLGFGLETDLGLDDLEEDPVVMLKNGTLMVDAFDLSAFYLKANAKNFDDFFAKVINPVWLLPKNPSRDSQIIQVAKDTFRAELRNRRAVWSVRHRVTAISRRYDLLPSDFNQLVE